MKQTIKLNESELKKIVAESIKSVLKEDFAPKTRDEAYWDNISQEELQSNPKLRLQYKDYLRRKDGRNGHVNTVVNNNVDNTKIRFKQKLGESVERAVKSVLKESLFTQTEFDENVPQKATCPSDVFKMNYWTGKTVQKGNGELILRCYTDNNSMATRNYPEFEKVVNDLNQYYKLHGSKSVAQALPDDGVSRGRLLKITKKA